MKMETKKGVYYVIDKESKKYYKLESACVQAAIEKAAFDAFGHRNFKVEFKTLSKKYEKYQEAECNFPYFTREYVETINDVKYRIQVIWFPEVERPSFAFLKEVDPTYNNVDKAEYTAYADLLSEVLTCKKGRRILNASSEIESEAIEALISKVKGEYHE